MFKDRAPNRRYNIASITATCLATVAIVGCGNSEKNKLHEPTEQEAADHIADEPTQAELKETYRYQRAEERRHEKRVLKATKRINHSLDYFKGDTSKLEYLAFIACKNTPDHEPNGIRNEPGALEDADDAIKDATYKIYEEDFQEPETHESQFDRTFDDVVRQACPEKFPEPNSNYRVG